MIAKVEDKNIDSRKNIKLNIFAIGNSKKIILNENGISENWKDELTEKSITYQINEVIEFAKNHHLENLIAIDNTTSHTILVLLLLKLTI